jgi:hypothetical protein
MGFFVSFFNKKTILEQRQYFYRWKYYLYKNRLYNSLKTIIKWLSLFENSPSLLYVRRS